MTDKKRIDKCLIDCGHAINANNGQCFVIEDALCLTTSVVVEMEKELERLTTALHAAMAHPDYSYIVVPADGVEAFRKLGTDGMWEPSPESQPGWPGDKVWRIRKEPTQWPS